MPDVPALPITADYIVSQLRLLPGTLAVLSIADGFVSQLIKYDPVCSGNPQ